MSIATERKILSLSAKKPGMWHVPSEISTIEANLRCSAAQILHSFARNYPGLTYDDNYRLQRITAKELTESIAQAHEALKNRVKYSTQLGQLFEKMTNNVSESLSRELGEHAHKFTEALENFVHPKEMLPKVALTSSR